MVRNEVDKLLLAAAPFGPGVANRIPSRIQVCMSPEPTKMGKLGWRPAKASQRANRPPTGAESAQSGDATNHTPPPGLGRAKA